jgi:hypothetical protein
MIFVRSQNLRCPILGVERTWRAMEVNSAFDPKQTLPAQKSCWCPSVVAGGNFDAGQLEPDHFHPEACSKGDDVG